MFAFNEIVDEGQSVGFYEGQILRDRFLDIDEIFLDVAQDAPQ